MLDRFVIYFSERVKVRASADFLPDGDPGGSLLLLGEAKKLDEIDDGDQRADGTEDVEDRGVEQGDTLVHQPSPGGIQVTVTWARMRICRPTELPSRVPFATRSAHSMAGRWKE